MNDTELDELLDNWNAPAPLPSLRIRVLNGFAGSRLQPGIRKSLIAGVALAVAVLLLVVTQALPQTSPAMQIPYTVDSEFISYSGNGSPVVGMYMTSYRNENGNETVLSRSVPDNPVGNAVLATVDETLAVWGRFANRFIAPYTVPNYRELGPKRLAMARNSIGFITGCSVTACLVLDHNYLVRGAPSAGVCSVDGPMVGSETILNYPTTAVEAHFHESERTTIWMAPDLGCLALRIRTERSGPDGAFHIVAVRQATKVTLNPR